MKDHKKKIIAPIVVTAVLVVYYVLYFGLILAAIGEIGIWWQIFLGVFPVLFVILLFAVCIERIKEIKKGEEDDISKY